MRRVAILGVTGSIGRQALEIVDVHPGLELCALAAGSRREDALALAEQRGVRHVSVAGDPPLDELIHAIQRSR